MVNATATIPGLRTISVVIPQARILNLGQSLATGSYAFAGSAEAEMKVTDSATGQFLVGAIDQRAGGMALSTAVAGTWGDAKNIMNYGQRRYQTVYSNCRAASRPQAEPESHRTQSGTREAPDC